MSAAGFSYAQAARGHATPHAVVSPSNTSTTPPPPQREKDGEASVLQNASALAPITTSDKSKALVRALSRETSLSPRKGSSDAPLSPAASSTLVGTAAESASNFSLDEATPHTGAGDKPGARSPAPDEAAKKGGRKTKTAAKNADNGSGKASQADDSEKDKDKDKELDKVELAPAPPPAVNVWSLRLKEQAAKGKQAQAAASDQDAPDAAPEASVSKSVANNGPRPKEPRKPASVSVGAEPGDANGTAIGNPKASNRRLAESTRPGPDQPRRNGPRGTRMTEKDDRGRHPLPSVHDATSWPTPESSAAADDARATLLTDKADSIDKDAQDEAGSSKSRKKGWLPLPFVPTVSFQTPIPNVRGPKPKAGSRGARDTPSRSSYSDGAAANGSVSHEKPPSASPSVVSNDAGGRHQAKESSSSALPSRPSVQGPSTHKRFSADASISNGREPRKPTAAALPDKPRDGTFDQQNAAAKTDTSSRTAHTNGGSGETNGQYHQTTRSAHLDRHPASSMTKGAGHHVAQGSEHKDQIGQSARERTETRGERPSRGGFRGGRGSAQTQHMSHATFQPAGQRVASNAAYSAGTAALPPTAAPFNPPSQQFSYGGPYHQARSAAKTSSRSQVPSQPQGSFGNRPQNTNARLYMPSGPGAASVPGELQLQPISFPSFNPYMDAELLHGLTIQVEYYFSVDNLCKDVFLRRKMNDQGFVPLLVIAKFKRMSDLAPSLDFIRAACEQSENLDYVVDLEQNEWVRSRFHWGGFVLPPEDRDAEARKPGPDLRTALFRSVHSRPHQPFVHSMMAGAYPPMAQPAFLPAPYLANGHDLQYPAAEVGAHVDYSHPVSNGGSEPTGKLKRGESQLSATVPDFSPGRQDGAPTTLEDFQTCPDEHVEKLVVQAAYGKEPVHFDASTPSASGKAAGSEPYPGLRAKALEQRGTAKPGETPAAMARLYRFWAQSLPSRFNVCMYDDFRVFALEDARHSPAADFGLECLLQYYDAVFSTSDDARPYPAVFVPHRQEARKLSESLKQRANGTPAV